MTRIHAHIAAWALACLVFAAAPNLSFAQGTGTGTNGTLDDRTDELRIPGHHDATDCVDEVCEELPHCCVSWPGGYDYGHGWDPECQEKYLEVCPPPDDEVWVPGVPPACRQDAGHCHAHNGSPGCNQPGYCMAVCDVKPECCSEAWTRECAPGALGLATYDQLYHGYDGHAALPVAGNHVNEGESCGARTNEGRSGNSYCAGVPCTISSPKQPISCGDTVAGFAHRRPYVNAAGHIVAEDNDEDTYVVEIAAADDADSDGQVSVCFDTRSNFLLVVNLLSDDGSNSKWPSNPTLGGSFYSVHLGLSEDYRAGSTQCVTGAVGDEVTYRIRPVTRAEDPAIGVLDCNSFGHDPRGDYAVHVGCGDNSVDASAAAAFAPPAAQACDVVQDVPTCDEADGTSTVLTCGHDPFCCDTAWDVVCVAERRGTPGLIWVP